LVFFQNYLKINYLQVLELKTYKHPRAQKIYSIRFLLTKYDLGTKSGKIMGFMNDFVGFG